MSEFKVKAINPLSLLQLCLCLNLAGCGLFTGSLTQNSILTPTVTPVIAVSGITTLQGANAIFPITLSVAAPQDLTLQYTLHSGTAVSGINFTGTTGTIVIPKGAGTASISVPTLEDGVDKTSTSFTIELNQAAGAMISPTAATATGTINDASLILDLTTGTIPTGATFTRSTTGTYYNAAGLMVSAAIDTPRYDYDPTSHVLRGLLFERNIANQVTYSEDFSQAIWVKAAASTSSGAVTTPTGGPSAYSLVEDGTTAIHSMTESNISYSALHPVTASVFAKAGTRTKLRIRVTDGTNGFYYDCDLSAVILVTTAANAVAEGSVLATGSTGTSGVLSAAGVAGGGGVDDGGSGWKRCWVSGILPSADLGSPNVRMRISLMSGASESYAGNGTSSIPLWGAQWEEVQGVPTSYVATGASSGVGRGSDALKMPTAAWLSTADHTISVQFWRRWFDKAYDTTLSLNIYPVLFTLYNDPAATNIYGIQYSTDGPNFLAPWIVSGSYVTGAQTASAVQVQGVASKVATRREGSALSMAINGSSVNVAGSSTPSSAVDTLVIGTDFSVGGGGFNGHLQKFVYRPRTMTDPALTNITN